ncbi:hypothetical protein BDV18DRAFT_128614 [Aspergillus unguis]
MTTAGLSAVQASSGLVYDLANSDLDPETESRAILGLTTDFEVLFCGFRKGGHEFAFAERTCVWLPARALRKLLESDDREEEDTGGVAPDGFRPGNTCSCAVFQRRKDVACQHIFWLLDKLRGQSVSAFPQPPLLLISSDGHAQGPELISQFPTVNTAQKTLEDLAGRLNWRYVRSAVEGGRSRTQRARDILSAFQKDILPEELRTDLIEHEDEDGHIPHSEKRTPEQCVVQGDFEATVFRLAVHDDNVYTSLCKAMPPEACAAIYFDKILERSRKLLAKFDKYCLNLGRPDGQETFGKTPMSVTFVLDTLQSNILKIHQNIIARAPHGLQGAAGSLVTHLEDICKRNVDALAKNLYGRTSFSADPNEDEDSRNIYHQLIEAPENEGESNPILDALDELPLKDMHPFSERLQAVLHRVEVSRAPKGFILKLGRISREVESDRGMGIVKKRVGSGIIAGDEDERERESKRAR